MQQHNARSAPVTPTVKQIKHRLKYCVFLEISPALIAQICIDGAWNSIITSLNHILWCHHSSKSVWKCNIWWMWVCVHVPTTMFLEIYVSHDTIFAVVWNLFGWRKLCVCARELVKFLRNVTYVELYPDTPVSLEENCYEFSCAVASFLVWIFDSARL